MASDTLVAVHGRIYSEAWVVATKKLLAEVEAALASADSAEQSAEAIRLFKAAAQKFCDKVEAGKARSFETYDELRTALQYCNQVGL